METQITTEPNGKTRSRVSFANDLDTDLSTIACYAAGELDERRLGIKNNFRFISLLAERISDLFENVRQEHSAKSLFDPVAVVVMKRTFDSSNLSKINLVTVNDLVQQTSNIRKQLSKIVENPGNRDCMTGEEYQQLCNFCLVLSDQASLYEQSLDDWNPEVG
jgi:hypothetical protein